MDVHPTKNVSIGIDPYPNWGKVGGLSFFAQSMADYSMIIPWMALRDPHPWPRQLVGFAALLIKNVTFSVPVIKQNLP